MAAVAHVKIDAAGEKRVLYLVDKSGFGGVQTIAYTLMRHGVDERIGMDFFFLRNINDRFGMEDVREPNVFYSRATHRYSLRPFVEILRFIREKKVSILHLNGNKSIILGLVIKKLFQPTIKIIAHEHGGVFDYSRWYAAFLKSFRNSFDLFITISNYRKHFLVERCLVAPSAIRVIDNFVDPARLATASASACGHTDRCDSEGDKPFVIGYVGGLSRIKGCDVLIRALPPLRERLGNFRVMIAGDGPARAELEELVAALGLGDIVSFLGFVDPPGIAYAQFDMMVIPSRSEEGPICLYEAWMMGLPVVASNAPVLNERIRDGETGILFQSDEPCDLAEKIYSVCRNPDVAAHIRAGGSCEAARHTVERYRGDLRDVYLSL
ncbi:glycosyl transferase group 1 [Geobacter metallireducens RCH3]|uniref:Glycosyltransferase n=2 Tax=Geobacter metallireducens TaxID=28232 RepID=Q39RM8_GEOMG|nr:glycosyltransferase family 4 protein [Geobacter metallireducens]ABB33096.1 glycosyltransferase [Geobacter metallireducens GS-15]EHP84173.1 glycosyl transferase group 1 [Geobacter metallireducens RCH3]